MNAGSSGYFVEAQAGNIYVDKGTEVLGDN